jgi:uncharacterized protein
LIIPKLVMTAVLVAMPFECFAAGFDCAHTTSPLEKTICANSRLGEFDDALTTAYRGLRDKLSLRSWNPNSTL